MGRLKELAEVNSQAQRFEHDRLVVEAQAEMLAEYDVHDRHVVDAQAEPPPPSSARLRC